MEISILGPVEARRNGLALDLGGPKQRALLGLLATEANRVVATDRIAEELWAGRPPPSSTAAIQVYVSQLRKLLGDVDHRIIATRAPGYALVADAGVLDSLRFEQLLAEASDPDPAAARERLVEALALWRGVALDGVDAPFARAAASRFDELRVRALERRLDADLASGRAPELLAELEDLTERHPLHERFWLQRMLALYRSGRQADALACYQQHRTTLKEELGMDAGPDLQRLEQAILRQDPELEIERAAAAPRPRGNLPFALTSFIGRKRELDELGSLLETTRLMTILGLGGTGKSRLALELARARQGEGVDAWVLDVAATGGGDALVGALALAVGVREGPGRDLLEALGEELAARDSVIVLDAAEHDPSACSRLVVSLLAACPSLRVVATSREPLGLPGELLWKVPPLSVEDAFGLFADRAALAGPHAADAPQAVIRELVEDLDRIPLAVELSAAHASVLTIEEIAARIRTQAPLGEAPVRAALAWSYDRLTEAERHALRRLAVFVGGAMLEDVAAFTEAEAFPIVSRLTALTLVTAEPREGRMRYGMLDTVRQFAQERLEDDGETEAVRLLHLRHILAKARSTEPGALERDHDNVRAALAWATEGHATADGLALAIAAVPLWTLRGHFTEGRRWLAQAVLAADLPAAHEHVLAATLARGGLAMEQGDLQEAREAFEAALDSARGTGDRRATARALVNLAVLHLHAGQADRHDELAEEALSIARELGDDHVAVRALNNLGMSARRQARLERAGELYEEAAAVASRMGDTTAIVSSLMNNANVLRARGDVAGARARCEQALVTARRAGFAKGIAACVGTLGTLASSEGDTESAERYFAEALDIARDTGEKMFLATSLGNLAAVAEARGDSARARSLAGEYLDLSEQIGDVRGIAQAHATLAGVEILAGDLAGAHEHLLRSSRLRVEMQDQEALADCLDVAARLALAEDDPVRAAEVLAAADASRATLGTARDGLAQRQAAEMRDRCASALGPDGFREAVLHGSTRSPEDAMSAALRPG